MRGFSLFTMVIVHLLACITGGNDFSTNQYEIRREHDPDGIGKFYMGREIAHVMGHQGAEWLERPERLREENPDLMVDLLALKPGDVVADIGAGTGFISWRIAKKVVPGGKVLAVDIQPEMLERLSAAMKQQSVTNVVPVLGKIADANLPQNLVDLVIMVDVYHEFSHPREMMESIVSALKPAGRVAFVEFRAEDPHVPIKNVHKMSEAQVKKEAEAAGLVWIETIGKLPWQHLILFRKKGTE